MTPFTGKQYLQIDIANSFGLDDQTWDKRLKWFEQNEKDLEKRIHLAKEPAQFMAGVFAWRDTQMGIPTGYMCGLDATASGIQILSIMSGCKKSAMQCNLINTGNREDAYTNTHEHMNDALSIAHAFNRKDTKAALMTHMYASKAVPKMVFGEGDVLAQFYATVDDLMPGANELNKALLKLWSPNKLSHDWVMPDGFDVKIKVIDRVEHTVEFLGETYKVYQEVNMAKESSLSLPANIVHSIDGFIVREMNRRCNYSFKKDYIRNCLAGNSTRWDTDSDDDLAVLRQVALFESTGFLSAVLFNHLNLSNVNHLPKDMREAAFNLLNSVPGNPFELVAIHDCFRFHANNGNDVRQQYINILAELADSKITESIASELLEQDVIVPKRSNDLAKLIYESEYPLS